MNGTYFVVIDAWDEYDTGLPVGVFPNLKAAREAIAKEEVKILHRAVVYRVSNGSFPERI